MRPLDPLDVAELLESREDELVIEIGPVERVKQVSARLEQLLLAGWALVSVNLVLVVHEPFLEQVHYQLIYARIYRVRIRCEDLIHEVHLFVDAAVQGTDDADHPGYLVTHRLRVEPVDLLALLEDVLTIRLSVQRNSAGLNVYASDAELFELAQPGTFSFLQVLRGDGIETLDVLLEVTIIKSQALDSLAVVLLLVSELGAASVHQLNKLYEVLELSNPYRTYLLDWTLNKDLGRVTLNDTRCVVVFIVLIAVYLRLLFFSLVVEVLRPYLTFRPVLALKQRCRPSSIVKRLVGLLDLKQVTYVRHYDLVDADHVAHLYVVVHEHEHQVVRVCPPAAYVLRNQTRDAERAL